VAERGDGSFEWLRERLPQVPIAADENARDLVWVDEARTLAVSRDSDGRLELFLPGPPLDATIKAIRDRLEHQQWWLSEGGRLDANRLRFDSAPHFDGFVAFLCAELLENGASENVAAAFSRTEQTIVLALTRAALASQELVGLIGELLLLDRLTESMDALHRHQVLEGWAGSAPSSRDFRIGPCGVEVKATTGSTSTHHIGGLRQIEPGYADDGEPETGLFLLSVGLRWIEADDGGLTLPSLVDAISARLTVDDRGVFQRRLLQYGGDAGIGYDHSRDRSMLMYSRPFTTRFERLYDMTDPLIRLPRRMDLETYSDLEIDSLSFRVGLPAQVRGDINPLSGWPAIVECLRPLTVEG
jgi:hypothetical protein